MTDDTQNPARSNLAKLLQHQAATRPDIFELTRRLTPLYFASARDKAFEDALTGLCSRHAGGVGEARAVALFGATGSGKSRLARHAFQTHPVFPGFGDPTSGCAALDVRVPGACTLRVLGIEILRAGGYPIEDGRENVVWIKVRDHLQARGVLAIYIDEINNLVGTANPIEQQKIRNNLKALLNHERWPVVLVLSGTPASEPILSKDIELRRRIDMVWLHPLVAGVDNSKLVGPLAELCKAAQVTSAPDTLGALIPRLLCAGAFQYGICIEISIRAVLAAAADRAPLDIEHFAKAYASRTGRAADDNPFLSAAWHKLASVWATDTDAERAKDDDPDRPAHRGKKEAGL